MVGIGNGCSFFLYGILCPPGRRTLLADEERGRRTVGEFGVRRVRVCLVPVSLKRCCSYLFLLMILIENFYACE